MEKLWEKAFKGNCQDIEKAYEFYNQGFLNKCEKALRSAWHQLHDSITHSDKNEMDHLNYIIPTKHPAKPILDKLFSKGRPIKNENTLTKANFEPLFFQTGTHIVVASHHKLEGSLLKLYLDSEKEIKDDKPGGWWLKNRCKGAEYVRRLIKRKKLRYFTVPEKWLYPLPDSSNQENSFILIVQRMPIVPLEDSKRAWKTQVTRKILRELYYIISHGYASSGLPTNIPYCRNGKFACIDTEHAQRPPNYPRVKDYISSKMAKYWDHLITTGGDSI